MLVLIECKHYTHPVPVDDAEEFFAKVQQVAAANAKAVIASTAAFQSGTQAFAKSKGIGLLRYFSASNFKWELYRSPSASARTTDPDIAYFVGQGLSEQDFRSTIFDLYMQSPMRDTNSLWDFMEDIVLDSSLTSTQVRSIANSRSRLVSQVPFLEKDDLEAKTAETLLEIDYIDGEVPLSAICAREMERCRLNVLTGVTPLDADSKTPVLGRIDFDLPEIRVYAQTELNRGRDRFTLAHELAHHLLGHAQFMSGEFCDEDDFVLRYRGASRGNDIARMEFQANYFAASLLMPRTNFMDDFRRVVRNLDIADKGFGALYVDDQSCNQQNYGLVTSRLMTKYGVSRTAAKIRLESLGLLRDARSRRRLRPFQKAVASSSDVESSDK